MKTSPFPTADPYAEHRCVCGHLTTVHVDGGRCWAGDHIDRPCPCGGWRQTEPREPGDQHTARTDQKGTP